MRKPFDTLVHGAPRQTLNPTGVKKLGGSVTTEAFFDTVTVSVPGKAQSILDAGHASGINLRLVDADTLGVSFDETTKARALVAPLRESLIPAFPVPRCLRASQTANVTPPRS